MEWTFSYAASPVFFVSDCGLFCLDDYNVARAFFTAGKAIGSYLLWICRMSFRNLHLYHMTSFHSYNCFM